MGKAFGVIAQIIKRGGIGVLPTDTIYGIIGSALSKRAVSRVYSVRGRSQKKPCIILLPSAGALCQFGIIFSKREENIIEKLEKDHVSVVLPCLQKKWAYLHRGTKTLAFRVVSKRQKKLHALLQEAGPLIAPSANLQGRKPATTVQEARKYFNDNVDFYVSAGRKLAGKPSTVIKIENGKIMVLRGKLSKSQKKIIQTL